MSEPQSLQLRRVLGVGALIAYGVGDILGAGIYALIGAIAGIAGSSSWLSFAIAMCVAGITGLSYAELGSRFPNSGGESYFCQQAFRRQSVAWVIGWMVLCSGVVSMATVARAFAGYVQGLWPAASTAAIVIGFVLTIAVIAFWGIRQSSTMNIVCTMVELSGLMLVIVVGLVFVGRSVAEAPPAPMAAPVSWNAIAQGAALAFFAFIGFEDIVNVAEEVKTPERSIPIALITATVVAGTIYIVVVLVATAVVTPAVLAASTAPLLEVVRRAAPAVPDITFTIIALFAVANTALLNCVMASRLLYGMSRQRLVPQWLGAVHPRTRTPHWAIVIVFVAALGLALSGTLVVLAGTSGFVLLSVFATINVSLWVIKTRQGRRAEGFQVPRAVPIVGLLCCLGLLLFVKPAAILNGAIVVLLGLALAATRLVCSSPTAQDHGTTRT